MKYLKLWESFTSDLFWEIELVSYYEYLNGERAEFDKSTIKIISDALKEFNFGDIRYYGRYKGNTNQIDAFKKLQVQDIETLAVTRKEIKCKIELNILCLEDEWFLVRCYQWNKGLINYWKCDQLEGLIKLISQL